MSAVSLLTTALSELEFLLVYRNPIKDDVYDGHDITKSTTVFVNYQYVVCFTPGSSQLTSQRRGILRNDDVYEDPDTFKPERWLDPAVLGNKEIDPLEIAFGFGRR